MSRGLGSVAVRIKQVFDQHPTESFSTSELCRKVYQGQKVQKKHRVSVLRALRTLVRRENLEIWGLTLCHEKSDTEWFGPRCSLRPKSARRLRASK